MGFRIAQITDTHIGKEGEYPYGVDVRANFMRILEDIGAFRPDLIVHTGDLVFRDPDAGIYRWIKRQLDRLSIPYYAISGNHDDSAVMKEVFALPGELRSGRWYAAMVKEGVQLLFLDSGVGDIDEGQLRWLGDRLHEGVDAHVVFIHHPVLEAGVPYMEANYRLANQEQLRKVLGRAEAEVYVFCGHYHVHRTSAQGRIHQHITPSCFFQIDAQREDFGIDHYRIGWRMIEWQEGVLRHYVRYHDGVVLQSEQSAD